MFVIFVLLCMIVMAFLITVCLTLFRIEKSAKMTLIIAERRILETYSRKNALK